MKVNIKFVIRKEIKMPRLRIADIPIKKNSSKPTDIYRIIDGEVKLDIKPKEHVIQIKKEKGVNPKVGWCSACGGCSDPGNAVAGVRG